MSHFAGLTVMPNTPESYALPIKSAHCRGPRELSGESGYFVTPRSNDDCLLPGVGAVPRLIQGSLGPTRVYTICRFYRARGCEQQTHGQISLVSDLVPLQRSRLLIAC